MIIILLIIIIKVLIKNNNNISNRNNNNNNDNNHTVVIDYINIIKTTFYSKCFVPSKAFFNCRFQSKQRTAVN